MSFRDRMEKFLQKSVETSKEVLGKAKEKTKEAGEKGALKIKIKRLENQAEKKCTMLGSRVYELLVEKGQSTISKGTADIKPLLGDIKDLEKEIEENEEQLKKL